VICYFVTLKRIAFAFRNIQAVSDKRYYVPLNPAPGAGFQRIQQRTAVGIRD